MAQQPSYATGFDCAANGISGTTRKYGLKELRQLFMLQETALQGFYLSRFVLFRKLAHVGVPHFWPNLPELRTSMSLYIMFVRAMSRNVMLLNSMDGNVSP